RRKSRLAPVVGSRLSSPVQVLSPTIGKLAATFSRAKECYPMLLWSTLLAGLLGAGAEERPNQSLSITSVAETAEHRSSASNPSASEHVRSPMRITPRSDGGRFLDRANAAQTGDQSSSAHQRTTWWVSTALGLVVVL